MNKRNNKKNYIQYLVIIFVFGLMYILNVYPFINLYVNYGLTSMFIKNLFYSIPIIIGFSYILSEHFKNNNLIKLYRLSSFFVGVSIIFFLITFIINFFGLFISINLVIKQNIILVTSSIVILYSIINSFIIFDVKTEIKTKKISKNYKFIQISDLHFGSTNKKYVQRVIDRVNKENPDAIFITGDLVDSSHVLDEIKIFNKLKSKKYFILGNHETYINQLDVITRLEKLNDFHILDNETTFFDDIKIIGINQYVKSYKKYLDGLEKKDNKNYVIGLIHEPKEIEFVVNKMDLILSGHTHAGQIFPFNILVYFAYSYIKGLIDFKKENSLLYVSSGTGFWGPKMRLLTSNEIHIINMIKKD